MFVLTTSCCCLFPKIFIVALLRNLKCNLCNVHNNKFNGFLVKQAPGWGPEQRESGKTLLYPLIIIIVIIIIIIIIIILISFIILKI